MRSEEPNPELVAASWLEVARFHSPWEAELVCARLEAAGIAARLADQNVVRLDWFMAQAVGGVKVLVEAEQVEAAEALLAQPLEVAEVGLATAEDQPGEARCPRCGTANLAFERWSRAGFVGSLLVLGFPIPIPQKRWRCSRCQGEWRAEEVL